jgi:hypothetical protein
MMAMVLMVGLSPAIEAKSARHFGQKRKLPSDDSRLPSGFRPHRTAKWCTVKSRSSRAGIKK